MQGGDRAAILGREQTGQTLFYPIVTYPQSHSLNAPATFGRGSG